MRAPCSVNVEVLGAFCMCQSVKVPNSRSFVEQAQAARSGPCKMLSEEGWTGNERIGSNLNIDPSCRHKPPRPQQIGRLRVGSGRYHASRANPPRSPPAAPVGKGSASSSVWHHALRFSNRGPAGWAIAIRATGLPASKPSGVIAPCSLRPCCLGLTAARRGAERLHQLLPRVTVVRK